METPEEIKKIMANPRDYIFDLYAFMRASLAYIQQLEERNKTLEYTLLGVMHSIDKWLDVEPYDFDKDDGKEAATRAANAREVALKAIEQLESRLAQTECERDAAVYDIGKLVKRLGYGPCRFCRKTYETNSACCSTCDWQWRGVCPENTMVKHIPKKCRNYTIRVYDGMGCCLGTKEIDPCKGENCENWKPKEPN